MSKNQNYSRGLVSPSRRIHVDYSVFKKTAEEKLILKERKKKSNNSLSKGYKMCF